MSEEKKKKGRKKKEVSQESVDSKFATSLVEDVNENKNIECVEIHSNEDKVENISNIVEEIMVEKIKKVSQEETEKIKDEMNSLESIIEETIAEELNESVEEDKKLFHVSSLFTTEEKLYITKLVANGYRPFDIVKKARVMLKLNEEKQKRLSLNIRTIEQLMKALEA